jgi:hypothetical protein
VTYSDNLEFEEVPQQSIISFSIPFTSNPDLTSLDVCTAEFFKLILAESGTEIYDSEWRILLFPFLYDSICSPVISGSYRYFPSENVRSISLLLILSLISIFAVHCTESPLRILKARLDSDKAFNVWTGSSQERDLVCVPKTPAKFVYQITRIGTQEEVTNCVSQGHPLTFIITYRMIEKGFR